MIAYVSTIDQIDVLTYFRTSIYENTLRSIQRLMYQYGTERDCVKAEDIDTLHRNFYFSFDNNRLLGALVAEKESISLILAGEILHQNDTDEQILASVFSPPFTRNALLYENQNKSLFYTVQSELCPRFMDRAFLVREK